MNKTKNMLTGFAIFATILMLSATCIAGPVQEKENIEAIEESINQQLADLLAILNTENFKNEQEFLAVEKFITTYPSVIQGITLNYDEFQGSPEGSEDHWDGFLRNTNGEIYVPGTGWIEPTELWLDVETFLISIPMDCALLTLELFEGYGPITDDGPEPTCLIIVGLILIAILLCVIGCLLGIIYFLQIIAEFLAVFGDIFLYFFDGLTTIANFLLELAAEIVGFYIYILWCEWEIIKGLLNMIFG